MRSKTKRSTKLPAHTEELKNRLNVSIEEARRLTGYSRPRVLTLCAGKEWQWFPEGKRIRIVTQSILDYQDRKVNDPRKPTLATT